MDILRFDALARLIGQHRSRRALLPMLGGLFAASRLGAVPIDAASIAAIAPATPTGATGVHAELPGHGVWHG